MQIPFGEMELQHSSWAWNVGLPENILCPLGSRLHQFNNAAKLPQVLLFSQLSSCPLSPLDLPSNKNLWALYSIYGHTQKP